MTEHIPFVGTDGGVDVARKFFRDADVVRVPLVREEKHRGKNAILSKLWLD